MKVSTKCCSECLFSDRKIVSDKRKEAVLRDCARKDTHFTCHKTSIAGQDVCCRGFYENQTSQLIRIAQRLGCVTFVDVETLEKAQ